MILSNLLPALLWPSYSGNFRTLHIAVFVCRLEIGIWSVMFLFPSLRISFTTIPPVYKYKIVLYNLWVYGDVFWVVSLIPPVETESFTVLWNFVLPSVLKIPVKIIPYGTGNSLNLHAIVSFTWVKQNLISRSQQTFHEPMVCNWIFSVSNILPD